MGGGLFQILHQLDQFLVKPRPRADKPHPHAFFTQGPRFLGDIAAEQGHKTCHFDLRPFPVFCRESKNCQILDAKTRASFYDFAHAFGARMMPEQTRPAPLCRPTAIAIHDDRNVTRASLNGLVLRIGNCGHGDGSNFLHFCLGMLNKGHPLPFNRKTRQSGALLS